MPFNFNQKVKLFHFSLLIISCCLMFCSCHDRVPNSNFQLSLDDFQDLRSSAYAINSRAVRNLIDSIMRNDKDRHAADLHTRRYYQNEGNLLWITRHGVNSQADSLVTCLRTVADMGFDKRRFYVDAIARDIDRLRDLNLDSADNQINQVIARLEYRLTKAYFRYTMGQNFGFMNPSFVFNRLDTLAPNPYDSSKRPVRFRGLFDVKMAHADDAFYQKAMQMVRCDSVASFLKEVQPKNPFYYQLLEKLKAGGLGKAMRIKILCNMERCRWRQYDNPWQHEKYVVVNIPSFHLMAIDHQDTLSMRIGCGASKTKTPILNSHIKRMELNPQWFVPRSIVLHDMIHRVGNHGYFRARNYYVREVATGKEVDLGRVTRSMLISGAYGIAQRGGKGNALGRIIFRFDNNFSVFLHDTNSKGVFGQEDRGVSHGCIRIEKPYDFAVFLLADKNEKLKEKIYYSMTADSLANKKLVVNNVKVNPQVPLFITYYTLYPLAGGRIAEYSDVYGFDAVIFDMLRKYL